MKIRFATKQDFSRYMKATYLPTQKFSMVSERDSHGIYETFYIDNTPVAHINKSVDHVEAFALLDQAPRKVKVALEI